MTVASSAALDRAREIHARLPEGGLFAGHTWRISPDAFPLGAPLSARLERLGEICLRFYQAANRLYWASLEGTGEAPAWVARLLDQGKPEHVVALQRAPAFRDALPRVIRPDLLLTEDGLALTELDSIPGGIGLTAWFHERYAAHDPHLVGGAAGMREGWASLFRGARRGIVVVSAESQTYRPEMTWLTREVNARGLPDIPHLEVVDEHFRDFQPGDAVYRFFEMFDLPQLPWAGRLFDLAQRGQVTLTPPPRPFLEEKLLLALLWNLHLREFWQRELGPEALAELLTIVPRSWVVDPTPLPPHAVIAGTDLTDWAQLKARSQREREVVLKVSGFSPDAYGARGVHLGSDLSAEEWSRVVDAALAGFATGPSILQRYHKPRQVRARWLDLDHPQLHTLSGRVRLCPYYFVDAAPLRPTVRLGGCLATLCPPDKKIIHGMSVAILAPCSTTEPDLPAEPL